MATTTEPKKSKYRFQTEIQQMMFVFGEVSDPLQETTMLVEDIVRSQVIEIIIQAAAQANRRNSRYLSAEDILFLIRHDRAKVNRLRSFLSWKDVRKNAKDASGEQVEDVVEETNTGKLHRSIIKLPWELINQFSDAIIKSVNGEDESEDEDELEAYNDSAQRLKEADEVTRAMTKEEYVHYSECRQASFTYRKSKKFRDWANMSAFVEVKPNDDIVDSLGFLTYEMVSKLTLTAIKIKRDMMAAAGEQEDEPVGLGHKRKREQENQKSVKRTESSLSNDGISIIVTSADGTTATTTTTESSPGSEKEQNPSFDADNQGLFMPSRSEQTPLLPEHIHEAFRRLQQVPQPLKNFRGGLVRTKISLI
ncbi:TFIID-18kDa-domain-containing protein [Rhizopus microsporus var. microsporus]|uniref:TFIID-18kDa-domain-containing protein n=1 Tax=Rhizopus microsporus var. microsporus TaxID=86635 RepID=A0A1X0R969_RHIZD|nr:TFIID-18kDa-domain-containing protein [Rhizopus microsporus var. microsporus]